MLLMLSKLKLGQLLLVLFPILYFLLPHFLVNLHTLCFLSDLVVKERLLLLVLPSMLNHQIQLIFASKEGFVVEELRPLVVCSFVALSLDNWV